MITIPVHQAPIAIDFFPFIHALENEKGYDIYDMSNKHSAERTDPLKRQWLVDNGYAGKEYVLDYPTGSKNDWATDSPEMKLRVEINSQLWPYIEDNSPPYQNVWHWLIDNIFLDDASNGCYQLLPFSSLNTLPKWYKNDDPFMEDSPSTPEYVERVLQDIFEACKGHPAMNDNGILFWIEW